MTSDTKSMFGLFFPEKSEGRFYVYILFRPNGRPFYVGKGCGYRIKRHEEEARRGHKCYKCNVIRKIWRDGGAVDRQIVFTTDDELAAFKFEAQLIQRYRSQLANIADYDARIWRLIEQKPPRKTKEQRRRERIADAISGMNALDRRLRRAVLIRDYVAQERIEAEIEAYRSWIRPPIQLRFEDF